VHPPIPSTRPFLLEDRLQPARACPKPAGQNLSYKGMFRELPEGPVTGASGKFRNTARPPTSYFFGAFAAFAAAASAAAPLGGPLSETVGAGVGAAGGGGGSLLQPASEEPTRTQSANEARIRDETATCNLLRVQLKPNSRGRSTMPPSSRLPKNETNPGRQRPTTDDFGRPCHSDPELPSESPPAGRRCRSTGHPR